MESEYVTGRKYIYTTGKGEQRYVTLGAIKNGEDGTIKFDGSGRTLTVPLGKLTALPANSPDNTKNVNGAPAPESEIVMATAKEVAATRTRKSTGKAPVKRTPKTPALPPVTATPATVGNGATVKIPGLDVSVPAGPPSLPIPPQSPPPAVESTPTPKQNGKTEMEQPTMTTLNVDPLSYFAPVAETFEICDQHRDGGEDEILRTGEWFKIPGTPIPNGPVTTVCDATVWRAIDDIRRHWTLLRNSVEWLDAWIAEQGDNLPARGADEFQEYDEGEGVGDEDEDEDPDENPATPPALPAPGLPAPAPARAPSAALNAVRTDLGTATVATAPRTAATGGGQKGVLDPGPSRTPKTLDPRGSKHAKQWAHALGLRTNKGELITPETRAKLPGTVLQRWVAEVDGAEALVRTWEPK